MMHDIAALPRLWRSQRAVHQSGAAAAAVGAPHRLGHPVEPAAQRGSGLCALRQEGVPGGAAAEAGCPSLRPVGPAAVVG